MKRVLIFLMLMVFVLTGCFASVEKQLEKAENLVDDEEYAKAIEIYEKLIDKDELTYEAWLGLARAYVEDEEFKDADDTLADLFDLLKDNYDEDNEEVDFEDIFDEMNDIAKDFLKEDEDLGDWYSELNPPAIDLYSQLAYSYGVGDVIELDIPKGFDLYYSLDGSKASKKDDKYKDGIKIEEEGDIELVAVLVNEFGMEGEQSYGYFSVVVRPDPPVLALESGEYDGPLVVYFEDFDSENLEILYTTDGSDPIANGWYYYEEEGIELVSGTYTLSAVMLDYNTYEYSEVITAEYTVNNLLAVSTETVLNVAVFDVYSDVYDYIGYALSDLTWDQDLLTVNVYEVEDLESAINDLNSGAADAIYSPAMYIEDFVEASAIMPISDVFKIDTFNFYNNAQEAGKYKGEYYSMPVAIDPDLMLYYNSYYGSDQVDTWDNLLSEATSSGATNNFVYPEEYGYWFNTFYLGFGGTFTRTDNGPITLDYQPLVDAINFSYDLTETYGLGFAGMSWDDYNNALANGDAAFVITNPIDVTTNSAYYNYYPAGQMPLPNGAKAKTFNLVDGLAISSTIEGNADKLAAARAAFDYLAHGYYISDIASYGEMLPADIDYVQKDYLYLNGAFEVYEAAINNNISMNIDYAVFNAFDVMGSYLTEVFYNGMTPDEAAKGIIADVAAY